MGAGCALPLTPPGPPSAGVHANRNNRLLLAVESHLSLCAEKNESGFKPPCSFWRPLQVANMALEKESVSNEFGLRDLQVVQLLLLLMFQKLSCLPPHLKLRSRRNLTVHLVTSRCRRSPSLDYR